jgi:hypothetical protein
MPVPVGLGAGVVVGLPLCCMGAVVPVLVPMGAGAGVPVATADGEGKAGFGAVRWP